MTSDHRVAGSSPAGCTLSSPFTVCGSPFTVVVLSPLPAIGTGALNIGYLLSAIRRRLSPAEKFALAIELWDELASNPDEIPVTDEQLNELDRRFEEYQRNPDKVLAWEDVEARILSAGR
jgi:putative addiction module component (TIGR02574 family)